LPENNLFLLNDLKNQVTQLDKHLAHLNRQSDRYTNFRLISFILGALASGAVLVFVGIWQWVAATPITMTPFVIAISRHRQVEAQMLRETIWLKLKQSQIARMTLTWDNIPASLSSHFQTQHPFASDLDLIGEKSLHQLIDTAVTLEGSQRLLDWLSETRVDFTCISQRQKRIQELVPLTSFRDELGINSTLIPSEFGEKWSGNQMVEWLQDTTTASLQPVLKILIPLAMVNITLGVLYFLKILPPLWIGTVIIYGIISAIQIRKIGHIFQDAFLLRDGLYRLGRVFNFLETYDYGGRPHLEELCRPFIIDDERPSSQLSQVQRVVSAVSLQKNPFLWGLLNFILPWDIYFAHRMDICKQDLKTLLPNWLDVWFELEALSSFATYAYLNLEVTFPKLLLPENTGENISFAAQNLGHPLIPADKRICNDFSTDKLGSIFIITGSNMAGKSTFLRTLGVNLAMAYAGGPVVASNLTTSLFRLFTAIRVTDSVIDGFSYFYAEVRRLKALLGELERESESPLFFLIDEIFRGTNNRERLIGSRAYTKALAGGNGIGVIATHDLELVHLAEEMTNVKNYHFRDDVQDGRMVFDYKLYPGPCPTTNALKIMQLAGLPVAGNSL